MLPLLITKRDKPRLVESWSGFFIDTKLELNLSVVLLV